MQSQNEKLSGDDLAQHLENMRDTYKRLSVQAGLQSVALADLSLSQSLLGSETFFPFIQLMPHANDGDVWLLKRPYDQSSQSIYLHRREHLVLVVFIETGHPIVKSVRRILTRSLKNLAKKKSKLMAQNVNHPIAPPPSWGER